MNATDRAGLSRTRKLLYGLIVNLLIFGLIEGGLWIAGVDPIVITEDLHRGFEGAPSVYERAGAYYQTRPEVIDDTFNLQSFAAEKPDQAFRLFSLGGSTTFGFPWGAEASFTQVLGSCLQAAHPGRKVEAINAGGISYAMHRVERLSEELVQYKPDLLIIYSGHNEFIEKAYFEQLRSRAAWLRKLEGALAYSRLYSVFARRRPSPEKSTALASFEHRSKSFTPEEKQEVLQDYEMHLKRLIERATKHGSKVILCTLPSNTNEWLPVLSSGTEKLDPSTKRQWDHAYQAVKQAMHRRDAAVTEQALEQALALTPDHAELYFLKGKYLEALRDFEGARRAYEQARDLDASPSRCLSGMNTILRTLAEPPKVVLVDIERAFNAKSPDQLVGFNLIEDHVHPTQKGHQLIAWQLWQAIEQSGWMGSSGVPDPEVYARVIRQAQPTPHPRSAAWSHNQGVLLRHRKHYLQARDKFAEALEIDQGLPQIHYDLASQEYKLGKLPAAIHQLKAAMGTDENHQPSWILYGDSLLGLRRYPAAIEAYQQALNKGEASTHILNNYGNALHQAGRQKEAVEQFEAVLALEPAHARARLNLGNIALDQKDWSGAKKHYLAAIHAEPTLVDAYNNLGRAFLESGELEQAAKMYVKAGRLAPQAVIPLVNLASVRIQQSRFAEARQLLERALSLNPAFTPARQLLGTIPE